MAPSAEEYPAMAPSAEVYPAMAPSAEVYPGMAPSLPRGVNSSRAIYHKPLPRRD